MFKRWERGIFDRYGFREFPQAAEKNPRENGPLSAIPE
jgi:hypothetical protein